MGSSVRLAIRHLRPQPSPRRPAHCLPAATRARLGFERGVSRRRDFTSRWPAALGWCSVHVRCAILGPNTEHIARQCELTLACRCESVAQMPYCVACALSQPPPALNLTHFRPNRLPRPSHTMSAQPPSQPSAGTMGGRSSLLCRPCSRLPMEAHSSSSRVDLSLVAPHIAASLENTPHSQVLTSLRRLSAARRRHYVKRWTQRRLG